MTAALARPAPKVHGVMANIPLALQECLLPSELGALVELAEENHRPVDDEVVMALREYVANHKPKSSASRKEAA
jgi:hypothetical protein